MSAFHDNALMGASGQQGYKISRSVRLRSSASAYFNRTPASATNRQIMTFSMWVKLGSIVGSSGYLISANTASGYNDGFGISFSSGTLDISATSGGATVADLNTTQVFRDPSAWYHIVYAVDTTQATSSNRIKLYINGLQVTSFSTATYPSQNASLQMNNTVATYIGRLGYTSSALFDGYLTEINFIDGQALTPSSFGQTNAVTGVWQPIKYTGTYGTNGFYLNFSDNSAATAAAIGKDYSGNGNNWTPNNISVTAGATYDSMLDVPTMWADGGNGRGNYCVISPLSGDSAETVSNGNLTVAGGNASGNSRFGSVGVSSGKWYWEHTVTTAGAGGQIAGVSSDNNQTTGLSGVRGYYYNGNKYTDATASAYGASFTTGDVIGVALDLDGGTLTFYKNNVSQGTAFTGLSGTYFPLARGGNPSTAAVIDMNFGQRQFTYTPPTGFVALNTQNLPNATIKKGNQYFDATTYTGNGTSLTVTNAGAMQPDFVWIKSRSGANSHWLVDAIRGVSNGLVSNSTGAEQTLGLVTAFNSNGFSVAQVSTNDTTNGNAMSLVGWQWNAGGSTVSNTSGSITSSVRANPTAGFSIVTYTGTGANATVGHGLGVAPKMIIVKNRDNSGGDWAVYHASLTSASYYIKLNLTAAQASSATYWNSTAPTSTVFTVGTNGDVNQSTQKIVAYCFAEVAGYSKFGSYTGNGSADGPFVYCGFRPKCVFIKRTDSAGNWYIYDSVRDAYNAISKDIYPNLSNAESENYPTVTLDIVSNGFKLRRGGVDQNASGGTYIFAAFAENPYKLSLAR